MRPLAAPIVLAVVALLAAAAQGEVAQRGNLRVSFDGRLSPRELPRDRPAPVTARLDGSIRMVDGSSPPPLRRISVAVNRRSRVSFAGLPTCPAAALQQTTTEAALALCRRALVGRGRFAANVAFPSLPSIPAEGRLLAFNGRWRDRPALLLHIYGSSPVRATFVLPFTISRQRRGELGTVFSATIPRLAADLGYVTDIELTLGRRYRHGGAPAQLPQRQLRRSAGVPHRLLPPRQDKLPLRRRAQPDDHARPRLPGPVERTRRSRRIRSTVRGSCKRRPAGR